MAGPHRPGYEEAERIHAEVMRLLREEEDAKGDLRDNGEARGLNHMKKALEREIDRDATDFLKKHGFNGYGLKKKTKRRGR